jgi:hypothetical protein
MVAGVLVLIAGAIAVAQNQPSPEDIFADKTNEGSKEEIIEEDETLVAIGEANPAPRGDVSVPNDDPEDVPVWEKGIFEGGQDFPSGAGYDFNTIWQGTNEGLNIRVYAGSLAGDDSRGIVLVDIIDPSSWGHTFKGPLEAPIPGPLQIASAKGMILTLSGSAGTSVHFDVATFEYVA